MATRNQIKSPFSLGAARGKGQDAIKGRMTANSYLSTPGIYVNKKQLLQLIRLNEALEKKGAFVIKHNTEADAFKLNESLATKRSIDEAKRSKCCSDHFWSSGCGHDYK